MPLRQGNQPPHGALHQLRHLSDGEILHLADWLGALERRFLHHALGCDACGARLLEALAERGAAAAAVTAGAAPLSGLIRFLRALDPTRPGRTARERSFPARRPAMHTFDESQPPAGGGPLPVTEKLKAERIQLMIEQLPTWELRPSGAEIRRSWTVPGLWAGTAFAGGLAAVVEQHGHEATIVVTPAQVRLTLSTPAANGLTQKDFEVAAALEFGA